MHPHPINATEIRTVVHIGTHVDAPRHFFGDGPTFDPPSPAARPGVVWRLDLEPGGLIEAAHFETARPVLRPGDIVALDTGWAARFGTEPHEHHPASAPTPPTGRRGTG